MVFVQNPETNQAQRVTVLPNQNSLRLVERSRCLFALRGKKKTENRSENATLQKCYVAVTRLSQERETYSLISD